MKRREFIGGLGCAAVAWPLAARAQQPAMPVIGVLSGSAADSPRDMLAVLQRGITETGFVEGKHFAIEYRWADGHYERLPALAADLVNRQVAVIFASGNINVAQAAKNATTTIPVVFANGGDPITFGLVSSINRPGGNVTGVSFYFSALGAKRLEILRELVPAIKLVGHLINPNNSVAESDISDMQQAAHSLGIQIALAKAGSEAEFDAAYALLAERRVDALVVNTDSYFNSRREKLVTLAARYALPVSYTSRLYVAAGGLLSYGTDTTDMFRQAGIYVGRILRGEKPADLPVLQPTKFEFVINLKTAKTLGLDIPPMLLGRADEVIE